MLIHFSLSCFQVLIFCLLVKYIKQIWLPQFFIFVIIFYCEIIACVWNFAARFLYVWYLFTGCWYSWSTRRRRCRRRRCTPFRNRLQTVMVMRSADTIRDVVPRVTEWHGSSSVADTNWMRASPSCPTKQPTGILKLLYERTQKTIKIL